MKIKFFCNSGANIHSTREEVFTPEDLGYTEEEWREMSDDEKWDEANAWAQQRLKIGYIDD